MQDKTLKNRYYHNHLGDFRRELREAIPRDILRELHQRSPWKHFRITLRQLLIGSMSVIGIIAFEPAWIWLPCAIVLGFVLFDFTVLLHEAIHHTVFVRRLPRLNRFLERLYALPSGISPSQFTRWHLDHHEELGSPTDDPKRAHLTPKIVKRWYKFLYMTPVLFPIYFRAAAREMQTYSTDLQQTIQRERRVTILVHFSVMATLIGFGGIWLFLKLYAFPYFLVFPVAFTINRVGQHYNVNPDDVAQWTTLMKGNFFWDFVYLYSNYHLEHHYYPGVPCYNLPRLHTLLQPLYDRHAMKAHSYSQILYGWFVQNRNPHTNWSKPD